MDIYNAPVFFKMRRSWRTDTNNATIQQKLYENQTVEKKSSKSEKLSNFHQVSLEGTFKGCKRGRVFLHVLVGCSTE